MTHDASEGLTRAGSTNSVGSREFAVVVNESAVGAVVGFSFWYANRATHTRQSRTGR